jgi:antibiotic biosynthesis monooxygenase (ABM) superfamily enzyme
MILIAVRYAAPTTYTPQDNQTRFSKRNKEKSKTTKIVLDSNSNLTKSMSHHNQTKELTTWFLRAVPTLQETWDHSSVEITSSVPMNLFQNIFIGT